MFHAIIPSPFQTLAAHLKTLRNWCGGWDSKCQKCCRTLSRAHSLESGDDTDNKTRYETNDHERASQCQFALCACVCVCMHLCVKKSRQLVSSRCHDHRLRPHRCSAERFSWHSPHWPRPVCFWYCLCVRCTESLLWPCQSDHDSPHCVCVNQGWPFALCVPGNIGACVCVLRCRHGKSQSSC